MDGSRPSGRLLESISIVLPAHNEEENILEAVLRAIARAFRELFRIWWGMHHPAVRPLPRITHKPVA
jgi:hypothetical protein